MLTTPPPAAIVNGLFKAALAAPVNWKVPVVVAPPRVTAPVPPIAPLVAIVPSMMFNPPLELIAALVTVTMRGSSC